MRPVLCLFLFAAAAPAADDLAVLPTAGPVPPKKMLEAYLLGECRKAFAERQAAVEGLKTAADITARGDILRRKFAEAVGGFPERTPLNPKVVGSKQYDGYRVERVIYESRPGHHVTANLYLPDGKGPFPGVLMPMGHSTNGKAAGYQQKGAILCAKNGLAALVYDPIGQGERRQLLDDTGKPLIGNSTSEHTLVGLGALLVGRSTAGYRIWDGIRGLDYLASRPEIDPKKLGCTGVSGGGTLTSYLMALDDRIAAAAPSCYLTTLDRLFTTLGPQDAEQNVTGQVAFGMDHPDYILMRAPKPTLVMCATRDFFDIQGTWACFREAKRLYTLMGVPERVEIIEANTGHDYSKAHREGMTRFFRRWLLGKDEVVVEGDWPVEKDAELQCTRTGQVLDDLKGKSCFALNAEALDALSPKWQKPGTAEFRSAVAKLIAVPEKVPAAKATDGETVARDRYLVRKKTFETEPGVVVPALHFFAETREVRPLVVFAHERGKAADLPAIEALLKAGKNVLAVDLRGLGETSPGVVQPDKRSQFGVEYKESFLSLHLNRPLLGQRVYDLMAVVGAAGEKGVEVVGVGAAGPVVLHAALLDDRITAATVDGSLASWASVVRTPINSAQLPNVVPGALAVYDLPALGSKKVTVRNPVDATGRPLP